MKLVPFEREYIEHLYTWRLDPAVSLGFNCTYPMSMEQLEIWYSEIIERKDILLLRMWGPSLQDSVGMVGLWNINRVHQKAEVRIIVAPDDRSKGFGREAINAICDIAFKDMNLRKLYAYVLVSNEASGKLFDSCGFKQEGYLKDDIFSNGKYVDVYLFAKIRE